MKDENSKSRKEKKFLFILYSGKFLPRANFFFPYCHSGQIKNVALWKKKVAFALWKILRKLDGQQIIHQI